jgi:hypothetical protein
VSEQPSLSHLWEAAAALRLHVAGGDGASHPVGLVGLGPQAVTGLEPLFEAQVALTELLASKGKGPLGDHRSIEQLALGMPDVAVGGNSMLRRELHRLRVRAVLEQLTALEMECAEIRDWLPWKTWKTYEPSTPESRLAQQREIGVELADILHFLVNIAALMGISPRMLAALFFAKHEENVRRVQGGY